MFPVPETIQSTVFATLPDEFRKHRRHSAWLEARSHGEAHSFLEGPSFDRDGNLYCTDIPFGRIFKVTPDGVFHLVAEYDGEPNGLKIHADGRLFIADHKRGLLVLEVGKDKPQALVERAWGEAFRGLNDLVFANNGDVYFTDQGQSGLQDASGRVFRYSPDRDELEVLLDGVPSPNGLALNADNSILYLNVTRANAVWRLPLDRKGHASKVGLYLQLSGGGGPDGLAVDADGGLAVAHTGMGAVWVFDKRGIPKYRVDSCAGVRTTNLAYGGEGNRWIYVTESNSGTIVRAELPTAGLRLFSHAEMAAR
ncbi:SMP-30/gluconolactonase/LRE family protein [Paraburkholderia fungorum]|uniref:SMP-30/gluconolactonase/LRE family protein n=1 Tax=Paraburkholderia fungorum TaxID=134537 RepID=UPI0038B864D2